MINNQKNKILISLKHNKKCINSKNKNLFFKYKYYFKWMNDDFIFLNLKKKNILKSLISASKKKKI